MAPPSMQALIWKPTLLPQNNFNKTLVPAVHHYKYGPTVQPATPPRVPVQTAVQQEEPANSKEQL
eukprot:9468230-Ditylum_brightwellii.AAC.1